MIITGLVHKGRARHITRKGTDKSLCGRWVVKASRPSGEAMCRTCIRIHGSAVEYVADVVHPEDRDALATLEMVASRLTGHRADRVRAIPGTVKRINAEWFTTMRVRLASDAKRKPSITDLQKSRDWAFATLVINAANRGEILTGKVEKSKPVEYLMNTAPTESDAVIHGDVMPVTRDKGGDGMVNPNSRSVAKPIRKGFAGSAKQLDLIHSLISQINEINAEIYPDVKPLEYSEEYIAGLDNSAKVRKDIDGLFEMLRVIKAKRNKKRAESRKAEGDAIKASREWRRNQVYVIDGIYHRVHISQSTGRPYTQSWNSQTGEWVYQGMKFLKACTDATACTAEQAKAWAHEHDACVFCHRPLDDQRSRNAGYGSTCADNFGLPWGE